VLVLVAGCNKSSQEEAPAAQQAADGRLRYTVRDVNGTRSSRNRDSVLKTVGMTPEQVRAWAKALAPDEARAVATDGDGVGAGHAVVTIRNERASVSSRDAASAENAIALTDDGIREWAKDDKGIKEDRSAMLFKGGYIEIIWRGQAGQVQYSVRSEQGSRTSRDRDSVLKTLKMTDEQVRAWAEDEKAAREARAATFYRNGYVEVISRGPAMEPPGLGQ
jgi:hypothetical protein